MHQLKPTPHQRSAIRIAAALLFLAMAAGLFVGGAKPVAVDLFPWPWGKLVHALTFGVLAMTVGIASGKQGLPMLATGFVSSVAVGALDEWHQTYLPGRHGQVSDVGFDAIGAALGVMFLAWFSPDSRTSNPGNSPFGLMAHPYELGQNARHVIFLRRTRTQRGASWPRERLCG